MALIEDRALSHHAGDGIADNLLVQGDNVAALQALLRDHEGQVRCVYIDPPFNTGGAFEHYDDDADHAAWLAGMRSRFVLIHRLLRDDGVLFVQLDDNEAAYCKVLLDELFGRANHVNQIVVATNKPFGFKATSGGLFRQANHILFYAKSKAKLALNKAAAIVEKGYDPQYKWVFDDIAAAPADRRWQPIGQLVARQLGHADARAARRAMGDGFDAAVARYAIEQADRVFRTAAVTGGAYAKRRETIERSRAIRDRIVEHPGDDMGYMFIGGERVIPYRDRLREIDGALLPAEIVTDIWTDIAVEGLAAEGGISFPKGKKPERLLQRLIALATDEGDLVLDCFAGSGTTAAVAHKMRRRWIAIERGDQAETHVRARLVRVIDGADRSGVTASAGWSGGGGFRYLRVA